MLLSRLLLVEDGWRGGEGTQVARHQHAPTLSENTWDEVIRKNLPILLGGAKIFLNTQTLSVLPKLVMFISMPDIYILVLIQSPSYLD